MLSILTSMVLSAVEPAKHRLYSEQIALSMVEHTYLKNIRDVSKELNKK